MRPDKTNWIERDSAASSHVMLLAMAASQVLSGCTYNRVHQLDNLTSINSDPLVAIA